MTVSKGRKAPSRQSKPAPAALQLEDFRYADQLGLALPQLVLAIEIAKRDFQEDARMPQFKSGRTWIKLVHQTAGRRGHQRYLLATVLAAKSMSVVEGINALNAKWLGSQAGSPGVSLDRMVDYDKDLKKLLGAGCNVSHHGFEEAFYSIDPEFLPTLAADTLPADLDDLIEWRTGFERMGGSIGRWKLVVLGTNSD